RDLVAALEEALYRATAERVERVKAEVCPSEPTRSVGGWSPGFSRSSESGPAKAGTPTGFCWSLKVDRVGFVDAFDAGDWIGVEELIVDVARDHPMLLAEKLDHWAGALGRDRIRLALPPLTRKWEEKGLLHKIDRLRSNGWSKWEAGNVSA